MMLLARDAGSVRKEQHNEGGSHKYPYVELSSGHAIYSTYHFFLRLAGFAQTQGVDTATEITGEVSVVIYDDLATGRSETRYYIINREKGRETRVFVNRGAPKAFATGKKVKVRGRSRKNGLEVQNLTQMEAEPALGRDRLLPRWLPAPRHVMSPVAGST